MTDNEQSVCEFFAVMGRTLEDFKRNYRVRMAENVEWETVELRDGLIVRNNDYLDTTAIAAALPTAGPVDA